MRRLILSLLVVTALMFTLIPVAMAANADTQKVNGLAGGINNSGLTGGINAYGYYSGTNLNGFGVDKPNTFNTQFSPAPGYTKPCPVALLGTCTALTSPWDPQTAPAGTAWNIPLVDDMYARTVDKSVAGKKLDSILDILFVLNPKPLVTEGLLDQTLDQDLADSTGSMLSDLTTGAGMTQRLVQGFQISNAITKAAPGVLTPSTSPGVLDVDYLVQKLTSYTKDMTGAAGSEKGIISSYTDIFGLDSNVQDTTCTTCSAGYGIGHVPVTGAISITIPAHP